MADTAETDEVLEIEDQDDLAVVKRMQEGRDKIVAEIKKIIIGQEEIIETAMMRQQLIKLLLIH